MAMRRKKYSREFKLTVVQEFEAGKTSGQLAREYDIHPSLPSRWTKEYRENPEDAFSGHGNTYKKDAKIAELQRLVGQLYAENDLLKKVLNALEHKVNDERGKIQNR